MNQVPASRCYSTFATFAPSFCRRLDQMAVAALDGFERQHAGLALGCEAGGNQRHARSQVAAVEHAAAAQLCRPGDDDAVGVGKEHVSAHAAHLFEREEAELVHPVVHERPSFGLRGEHRHEADKVATETPARGRS